MPPKIYPHDRLMAASILKLVPPQVTPNQLTITRILLTPAVLWLLWLKEYETGIAMFLLVAFTDMIDGSLARTRGLITDWGILWDPVADKLLIGSVVALLLFRHFPKELIAMTFILEAAFVAGAYYRQRQGVFASANWYGKLKMFSQVIGVSLFLLYLDTGMPIFADLSYAVIVLAVFLALGSLLKHGL